MSKDVRQRITRSIAERGVNKTAERLGMGVEPVLRIHGGLPVRAGTEALAQSRIDRLDKAG